MPTYTYECGKCGFRFEIEQRITAAPRKRCPECRGAVHRVIHAVNHILKGPGFYATDYRKPAGACDAGAEKETDASPACSKCPQKDGGCS